MMDQTVTLLVTAVCLFGTALGLRYRVYVLVPAGLAVLIISVIAQVIWSGVLVYPQGRATVRVLMPIIDPSVR
jgi:hypothetical protein